MFDLRRFVAECKACLDTPNPVDRVRALVDCAVAQPRALAAALPRSDEDETLVHADERIMLVHIQLTPNVHFPPHNHHMPVVVGLFHGVETNIMYLLDSDGRPRAIERSAVVAPTTYLVPEDGIHSVANHGETRSAALHVYLGDLVHQARTIWNPATFARHPYSDERYFDLAVPFDLSRPFRRPSTPDVHGSHRSVCGQACNSDQVHTKASRPSRSASSRSKPSTRSRRCF